MKKVCYGKSCDTLNLELLFFHLPLTTCQGVKFFDKFCVYIDTLDSNTVGHLDTKKKTNKSGRVTDQRLSSMIEFMKQSMVIS